MDVDEIGKKLAQRKEQLLAELSGQRGKAGVDRAAAGNKPGRGTKSRKES